MLRRKPSNASEKEPTQKKKVRSIFGSSLLPSLSQPSLSGTHGSGKSRRPSVESVGEGHTPKGMGRGPKGN